MVHPYYGSGSLASAISRAAQTPGTLAEQAVIDAARACAAEMEAWMKARGLRQTAYNRRILLRRSERALYAAVRRMEREGKA